MSARIFPATSPRRNRYNYQISNLNRLKVTCTLLSVLDWYRIIFPYWKTTSFFGSFFEQVDEKQPRGHF